ncbi:ubiquitin C-terminal hydrolase 37 [Aspergillus candidus]|uniref:Ubiquitin carboxyl-terminal hydrolase n=1 Tax=Aspergillus candidus TaxID=41067 RepID=A0A2I2FFI7_ASPCN|nr:ubiquitin carboxyl-terminal hydrolase [Aspergillus candidus]PLB39383.1 ubiquitin carboxyl-terminal hydrolase [Aspergillus candidus]
MTQPTKRRRLDAQSNPPEDDCAATDPFRSATVQEKQQWNGFCEIESEPALFNVMLREFGVKGVKVQEVISLDEEMMEFLNKPIYGLIFLFRWREDDPNKQEASCPDGLWFANQTASNSCASVALLNIVNNIEGVDLGENLQQFKDFTMPFTPALRGDAISNFDFVKRIHNSFARRMDILNCDLSLKHEALSRRSSSRKNDHDDGEPDSGFHFVAFVPALDRVWKFDGLERQPQSLGDCTPDTDWLDLVKSDILKRMAEYEEGRIEFSVLSLSKDPLVDAIDQLAINVRSLVMVNQRLSSLNHNPGDCGEHAFTDPLPENTLLEPHASYALTREAIDEATIPEARLEQYRSCGPQELLQHREQLSAAQGGLRAAIRDEQQSNQADDDYAAGRRYDYGPAIRAWVRLLARKGTMEDLT